MCSVDTLSQALRWSRVRRRSSSTPTTPTVPGHCGPWGALRVRNYLGSYRARLIIYQGGARELPIRRVGVGDIRMLLPSVAGWCRSTTL